MFIIPFVGLLTTMAATIFGVSFLNQLTNMQLHRYHFFVIFVIGAAIASALAVSGLYIARKIAQQPFKTYYLWVAIIAAVGTFFGITYMDYENSFQQIVKEAEAEYGKLSAEDIQTARKELSFGVYLESIYKESTVSISARRKTAEIDNEFVSMLSFWAAVISAAAGGWFAHNMAVGERTKAKGVYRDLKYIASLEGDLYDEVAKRISGKKMDTKFIEFLQENATKVKATDLAVVRILKDPTTGEGQVIVDYKTFAGKSNYTVDKTEQVALDADATEKLVEDIKTIIPKEKF
jgi:hypothetical protein